MGGFEGVGAGCCLFSMIGLEGWLGKGCADVGLMEDKEIMRTWKSG